MLQTNDKILWLDDLRNPSESQWKQLLPEGDREVIWVKNYDEFVNWIETNGLPYFISFDHDLADYHYTPKEYWTNNAGYYESLKFQEENKTKFKEKTGYDCAKWLVNYALDNKLNDLPRWNTHSANPVGVVNINNLLVNYLKSVSDV